MNEEDKHAMAKKNLRVLFTGYANIHFICFRSLYERLNALPGVELFLSGGLRTKTKHGYQYNVRSMYQPLGLPGDRLLTVDQIQQLDFDVLFAANTKLIQPRSVKTRIQIFHGLSFRNKAIRSDNMGCDYYFVVGPYMHRRFIEAGFFQESDRRAVQIGFMKTDRLLNGQLDRDRLLQRFGLTGERPVLLYAPTGAEHNSLETLGEEVIRRLASTNKYDLLIKLHDHPKKKKINWPERLAGFQDRHCRILRESDVIPLLYLADLLISDASSVSNEYALLDRPMVFLDTPKLLAKARKADGSMLDLETWGRKGGLVVKEPQGIEEAINDNLRHQDEHSPIRRAMAQDLFYNPGRSTETALAWLNENVFHHLMGHRTRPIIYRAAG